MHTNSRMSQSFPSAFCVQSMERMDVTYSVAALDFTPASALGQALAALAVGVAKGVVCALPHTAQPLGAVERAMRNIMKAQHVGKVGTEGTLTWAALRGILVPETLTIFRKTAGIQSYVGCKLSENFA